MDICKILNPESEKRIPVYREVEVFQPVFNSGYMKTAEEFVGYMVVKK